MLVLGRYAILVEYRTHEPYSYSETRDQSGVLATLVCTVPVVSHPIRSVLERQTLDRDINSSPTPLNMHDGPDAL